MQYCVPPDLDGVNRRFADDRFGDLVLPVRPLEQRLEGLPDVVAQPDGDEREEVRAQVQGAPPGDGRHRTLGAVGVDQVGAARGEAGVLVDYVVVLGHLLRRVGDEGILDRTDAAVC